MSYDLMVFEASAAPTSREEFMVWYDEQTKWSEGHNYQDPVVTSSALRDWINEMVQYFPAMNGPLASDDSDDSRVTDYCIGTNVIYVAFSWAVIEDAYEKMRELAIKHKVGFFDVSAGNGEILHPDCSTKL